MEIAINYYMKGMKIEEYKDKRACDLSGGNRRKLCTTLALIGGNDILVFDEPLNSVDPFCKFN